MIDRREVAKMLGAGGMLLGAGLRARGARAQEQEKFPSRIVQLVVPFTAGGTTDVIGRIVANELARLWGKGVVVINKPGATGIIGSKFVSTSSPDGYTLLMGIDSSQITAGLLNPPPPYDPVADFSPISAIAQGQFVLLSHRGVPVNSVADLVAYAKANPGKVSFASSGRGTTPHLLAEMFKMAAGVDLFHVPYSGAGPMSIALQTGEVQIGFPATTEAFAALEASEPTVKPLATPALKRLSKLPDIPTMAEAGYADVHDASMFGMLGPAKMNLALVEKINGDIRKAIDTPEMKQRLAELGYDLSLSSAQDYAAVLNSNAKRKQKLITDAKITTN